MMHSEGCGGTNLSIVLPCSLRTRVVGRRREGHSSAAWNPVIFFQAAGCIDFLAPMELFTSGAGCRAVATIASCRRGDEQPASLGLEPEPFLSAIASPHFQILRLCSVSPD